MDVEELRKTKSKIKESKGKIISRYINISNGSKELYLYSNITKLTEKIIVGSDKIKTEHKDYKISSVSTIFKTSAGNIISAYCRKNIVYLIASDSIEIYE